MRRTFEEWYEANYDMSGYLYPSCPMSHISFKVMCERVEEYLKEEESYVPKHSVQESEKKDGPLPRRTNLTHGSGIR